MIHNLRQLKAAPAHILTQDAVVAYKTLNEPLHGQFFCQRVARWEAVLIKVPAKIIALYHPDAFEFIAALFAIWRLRKTGLVPANNLPETCAQLSKITNAFAGDFPLASAVNTATAGSESTMDALEIPAASEEALILFTSGSSGLPQPIAKSFAQIEAELNTLQEQWHGVLKNSLIASTVVHHHIYGMLFSLLWPLTSGRPFFCSPWSYWENLVHDIRPLKAPLALVTSPAHLSRIPNLDWPKEIELTAIFSSGAPLPTGAAVNAHQQLGISITEIYGSTETGGIGWRNQTVNPNWHSLPGVRIDSEKQSQLLRVRSEHLPNYEWYTTADKVSIDSKDNNTFILNGRADRIVKVAGKRVSLTAIEAKLVQHEWVEKVRVLVLPERGEHLGAVVVLSHEGNKALVDRGKAQINHLLKAWLVDAVDRVATPRFFRYLADLPLNQQSKTTFTDLAALFTTQDLPKLPQVVEHWGEGQTQILRLFVPSNLYYFEGHFPGRPVLPGVVQVHWAIHYGRKHWGELGDFDGLEVIKFQQVVTTNQSLILRMEFNADKRKLSFSYTSGEGDAINRHASGRVIFRSGEENANG